MSVWFTYPHSGGRDGRAINCLSRPGAQTQLAVHADGACVFLPVRDILTERDGGEDDELPRLSLWYRHRLEFAVGRTCSAARRCVAIVSPGRRLPIPTAQSQSATSRVLAEIQNDRLIQ